MRAHWRQLAKTIELVHPLPTRVHNPNDKSIGSAVLHSLRQKVLMLYNGRPYTPELPLQIENLDLSCNTWCFGPMRAHNETAPRSVQPRLHRWPRSVPILYSGLPVYASKLPLPMLAYGSHVIRGSLGPLESGTQMATWSFQPFLQGSLMWQTDRATDRPTDHALGAMRRNNA